MSEEGMPVPDEGSRPPTSVRSAIPAAPPEPWLPAGDPAEPAPRPPATLVEVLGGPSAPDGIIERLGYVIDPELGVDIVGLGLVYDALLSDGVARVVLTTTTPACPVGSYLTDAVRWALRDLAGVERVDVVLTHEPRWTPRLMSDEVKARLGWTG